MQAAEIKHYYFIEVVNTGKTTSKITKGYIGLDEKGGLVVFNRFVSDIEIFETYQKAQAFVTQRPHFFQKPNINYYIKDNQDLMKEGKSSDPKEPLWTVENGAGWKLFWSDNKKEYYWDNKPIGHVVVHQAWIDDWKPRLEKKYPNMEIKFVPIGEKAKMLKL